MKIINDFGYDEIEINFNCGFDDFYEFASKLGSQINIEYKSKIDGFDSLWWDFDFAKGELMLCYNIYLGITICPKKCKNANETDKHSLTKLFEKLKLMSI